MNARTRLLAVVVAAVLPLWWVAGTAQAEEPAPPDSTAASATPTPEASPTASAPGPSAPAEPTTSSGPVESTVPSPSGSTVPSPSESTVPSPSESTEPSPSADPTEPSPSAGPTESASPSATASPTESAADSSVVKQSAKPTTSPAAKASAATEPAAALDAALALVIEDEGTTITFDPIGCATPLTPASARLEIANHTASDLEYVYEVTGIAGVAAAGVLPVPANDTDAAFVDEIAAGTYTITVTPAGGSPLVDTVDVPVCPPPTSVALALVDPGCGYVFTGDPFAGSGTATVTNQSSSIVFYEIVLDGPDGAQSDQVELRGGESSEIPLTGLPAGSYTLTVTTTDFTGDVVGTWTASDTLVACVVAVDGVIEILDCYTTYVYLANDGNVPVTVELVGSDDATGTGGTRLATLSLDAASDVESETHERAVYRYLKVVVMTPDGFSGVVLSESFDDRCQLAPRPITASARCGVVSFTNPADNGQVVVTTIELPEGSDPEDILDFVTQSTSLPPGATRTLMATEDFLVWVSALEPVDIDDPNEPFFFEVGFLDDVQGGACPVPPAEPTRPTQPAPPAEPTRPTQPIPPAEPTRPTQPIPPMASGPLAETGAPDTSGLAGFGLIAVFAGVALLTRRRG